MKAEKLAVAVILFLPMIVFIQAETVGDTGSQPVPNITEIEMYNVSGLEGQDRLKGGEIVDSGVNRTFELFHQSPDREYRFSFRIVNEGSENFLLNSSDILEERGLDSGWDVGKIWYNISGNSFGEGNFTDGTVRWNTSKGGTLNPGEEMYAKFLVNLTEESRTSYSSEFNITDSREGTGSRDHHNISVVNLGRLVTEILEPPEDTYVKQHSFFTVNSSVSCQDGVCGDVETSVRHNTSSGMEVIPESSGTPFYTNSSNPKVCVNMEDSVCYTNWSVNATGGLETYHDLDINSSSEYGMEDDSGENTVEINKLIVMNLEFDQVDFGVLDPGEKDVAAKGNSKSEYNISFSERSCTVDDLFIKSSPLVSVENDMYTIPPENLSVDLENSVSDSMSLTDTFKTLKSGISPGTVLSTYFFMDIPEGLITGEYRGNITFKANSTV